MTGNEAIFDTNAFIAIIERPHEIADVVRTFATLAITVVNMGELRFGALNSSRVAQNLSDQERRLRSFRIIHTTDDTIQHYAQVRLDLERRGLKIPANDLWIAALAIEEMARA